MNYVSYYHATADRIEHGIVTGLSLPEFLALEPYARVLAWIPVPEEGIENLSMVDGLHLVNRP